MHQAHITSLRCYTMYLRMHQAHITSLRCYTLYLRMHQAHITSFRCYTLYLRMHQAHITSLRCVFDVVLCANPNFKGTAQAHIAAGDEDEVRASPLAPSPAPCPSSSSRLTPHP